MADEQPLNCFADWLAVASELLANLEGEMFMDTVKHNQNIPLITFSSRLACGAHGRLQTGRYNLGGVADGFFSAVFEAGALRGVREISALQVDKNFQKFFEKLSD